MTTTEKHKSPLLYSSVIARFRGNWLQVLAGLDLGLPGGLSQAEASKEEVEAFSPGIIGANSGAFAGTAIFSSYTSDGNSATFFSIGFGYGKFSGFGMESYGDVGLSMKEGLSIPLRFWPINK
jgi:hypothetical protein